MVEKPETSKIESLPNGRMVDKYKIVKLLGQGGMGAVYLALNCSSGKEDDYVAIKVLFPHLAIKSGDFTRRFLREARIARKISHPNLVQVFECNFCDEGEFYYIVQEYVGGGTLKQLVANDTVLSEEDTLTVAIGVARALEAAHHFNVVHRDIKPDNIMFGNDGTVKVTDWGIAKKIAVEDSVSVTTLELTAAKVFMGTPLYASPEQIQDTKTVDIRADIYSLGATMYYSLVGKPPFRGSTEVESLCVILTKPAPDVRKARPDISEKTGVLIKRMLAKTPEERFQNPSELLVALLDAATACVSALNLEDQESSNGDASVGRMKHQAPNQSNSKKNQAQDFSADLHAASMEAPAEKADVVAKSESDVAACTLVTKYNSKAEVQDNNLSSGVDGHAVAVSDTKAVGKSRSVASHVDPVVEAQRGSSSSDRRHFPIVKVLMALIFLGVFSGGIWLGLRSLQTMKQQFEDNLQQRLVEAREMATYQKKETNPIVNSTASQTVTPISPENQPKNEQARQNAASKLATEQVRQETAEKLAAEQAAKQARQEAAEKLAAEQAAEQARQETAEKLAAEQAAEQARQEAAAKLAAEQAAEQARQEAAAKLAAEQTAEQARQEAAAKLAAEQAAEQARQEAAAKLAAEQTAEQARQEAAAKLAVEQAAEQARQEAAAKLAAEQAAEQARQEAAAKLAVEQAAEQARQEAVAKLAAENNKLAVSAEPVADSTVLSAIKDFLANGDNNSIVLSSELKDSCLRFRDAMELFNESQQRLVKEDYFRSSSSAIEFIATAKNLWETANDPKSGVEKKFLCDTAWQQMEAYFQQAAEQLQNSISVLRLTLAQQSLAKLYFLRVLAYCDELSNGKVSAWPTDFACRQEVSAFFPDVLLQDTILKNESGQLGLSPTRITWLQAFLLEEVTEN